MSLGYNGSYNNNGGEPKSRGLRYREEQVAALEKERSQFVAEAGSPITGNVSTRRELDTAKRALKRQQQYARGEYPSGR